MRKKLLIIMATIGLLITSLVWFYPKAEMSNEERRKLNQFPELSLNSVMDGQFMEKFENYAKDQFPFRFKVRQTKALLRYYGLMIFENNDFFKESMKAIKIEYPLNENSIRKASERFNQIYDLYLDEDNEVYLSVIPDKSYYAANKTIPKLDLAIIENILTDNMEYATYIDIKNQISLTDFYNTDIHWKQESLDKVAEVLLTKMNQNSHLTYTEEETGVDFKGVYYGHSALPLKSDTINYITNKSIEEAIVTLIDSEDKLPIYNHAGLSARDQYDFFLYGPQSIVKIENDNAESDQELIIFRDSFASSLTPYLVDKYAKITLIDIRYIPHDQLANYIEFNDQDILFIYNTAILNNSTMLR